MEGRRAYEGSCDGFRELGRNDGESGSEKRGIAESFDDPDSKRQTNKSPSVDNPV